MNENPYAPSASSLEGGSVPAFESAETAFRDLSGHTRKLSMLLLVGMGWRVVALVSALMQLNLISHPPYSVATANANDMRENLVSGVTVLLFIVTVIVFGRWIYLAQKNVLELDARHLRASPGWAVGSFFVPIVALWAPYQAMRDLAKASRSPRRWELEDTSPAVSAWWILWLIVEFLTNGVLQDSQRAHTLPQLQELSTINILIDVISLPLYFLASHIVRRVWRDQSESYLQMNGTLRGQ
jgi:hypothetical protein